jgi:hypothetical protein
LVIDGVEAVVPVTRPCWSECRGPLWTPHRRPAPSSKSPPSASGVDPGVQFSSIEAEPFDATPPNPTADGVCPPNASGDEPCMQGDAGNVRSGDVIAAFKADVCNALPPAAMCMPAPRRRACNRLPATKDGLPRRSARVAAQGKTRVSNPEVQAQNIMMRKWKITSKRSPDA